MRVQPNRTLTRVVSVVFAAAAYVGLLSADIRQTTPDDFVRLVAAGKVDDAWSAWNALPSGPEKLRIGVAIAGAAGQIARGLELYDQLMAAGQPPDGPALAALALGTANGLATSVDRDVRVIACGAAVVLQPGHKACRTALEQLARQEDDVVGRGLAAYALANAGIRLPVLANGDFERSLTRDARLRVAQVSVRLPPDERLAILRPLFDDPDSVVVYQALLVAGDVPGGDVLAALRALQPPPAVRMGKTIALVRHGDRPSIEAAVEMLDGITGYERVQVGRGLVESLDQRGVAVLEQVADGPVDIDRVHAAEALARINPDRARRALVESLTRGSSAVQSAALHAAGIVRIADDRAVYGRLTHGEEMVRAFAVEAVANTLVPLPPQPLPATYQ